MINPVISRLSAVSDAVATTFEKRSGKRVDQHAEAKNRSAQQKVQGNSGDGKCATAAKNNLADTNLGKGKKRNPKMGVECNPGRQLDASRGGGKKRP